jgi:sugar/nucleoside kinase (ribokinase family)
MKTIWTMGEILVEIMRPNADMSLARTGEFIGPFPSGAPAIFIDTVARLGHPAAMIGGVGADEFGRCVLDRLATDGVRCDHIKEYPHRSTAVAFVTYYSDGSRRFIYHIDGTPAVMNIDSQPDPAGAAYFHVMGCSLMANEAFRESILHTMQVFSKAGARISFDPNIRRELLGDRGVHDVIGQLMNHCTVLLPGVDEILLLSAEADVPHAVRRLFLNPSLQVILLKRGQQGCELFTRTEHTFIPAYPVKAVDPTGSGDCFDAAFLCGLLEGVSLEKAARMAAAAGALNAAAFGPMEGNISRQTIFDLIQQYE